MAASDYVPIFFKNRLHLVGRPQMGSRPSWLDGTPVEIPMTDRRAKAQHPGGAPECRSRRASVPGGCGCPEPKYSDDGQRLSQAAECRGRRSRNGDRDVRRREFRWNSRVASDRLVFDITNQVKQLAGQDITVEFVPERLGPDDNQAYPLAQVRTHEDNHAPSNYSKPGIVNRLFASRGVGGGGDHGSKFNVQTGAVVGPPAKLPLPKFAVRIQAPDVLVDSDPTPPAAVVA
jgi:hypothetical protein